MESRHCGRAEPDPVLGDQAQERKPCAGGRLSRDGWLSRRHALCVSGGEGSGKRKSVDLRSQIRAEKICVFKHDSMPFSVLVCTWLDAFAPEPQFIDRA